MNKNKNKNIEDFKEQYTVEPAAKETAEEKIVMDIADIVKEIPLIKKRKLTGNVFIDTYRRVNDFLLNLGGVKLHDRVAFFELLTVMMNSGIPLVKSLKVLSDQFTALKFKKIIAELAAKVERGNSLSDAMVDYPRIFTEAHVGMVAAAEASGKMNTALNQVAVQMEKQENLNSKIKGALIYPAAIFTLLICVVVLMLIVVIPQLIGIFEASKKELPLATTILLFLSGTFRNEWYKILILIGLAAGFMHFWGKTPNGRYTIDRLKLRLPVFGNLIRRICLARFSRALSSLLSSGVPIVKTLQISSELVGNSVYRDRINAAAEDVQRGIPMAETLSSDEFLFPNMVVSMIAIGEQTAEVHSVTAKIAEFYESQVDTIVHSLSRLLEPIVMVCIGLIVGGLVAAVMQPILSIGELDIG